MSANWRDRCGLFKRGLRQKSVLQLQQTLWLFVLGISGVITFSGSSVLAQITPDATLGIEGSVVTPNVNVRGLPADRIDGGALREVNLFHSFSQFNVGEGLRVYFANPAGIENILTRVTGNNLSNILGTLGVDGGASLFLLNPNGIIFGQNAKLDIAGSFVASTANSVVFENGFAFSAKNPEAPPLLTIKVPLGLQYGTNRSGVITNQGNLAVGSGQTLSLSGGTVTSTGSLTVPGGTVQLLGDRIGLLDNAQIDVSSDTGGGTVLIGGDFQGKGTVPNALRTFIGPNVTINANANTTGNGGRVIVWADEVTGFYGNISARGGSNSGNGGFVEVSGKQNLIFRGNVDNLAPNGNLGTLLLDPVNITIASGTGDSATDGTNTFQGNNSGIAGSILSAPLSAINDTAPTTIYESELERLSGETNIVLQATNTITVNNLADNRLSFAPGRGLIALTADADRDGAGSFIMQDTADTIQTNGRDIAISGASLTLGNINTAVSDSTLSDSAGQQLGTAQVVSTGPGTQLDSITGNLFSGSDVDLFQIYVTGGSTFAATTVGGTSVDTQLFLFNANGLGVYANDDLGGYYQSTLLPGHPLTPTAPGIYYLAISSYNNDPVSTRGSIFRGFPIESPTGIGGASPLSGWNNRGSGTGGNYTIFLTGAEGAVSNFIESAKSGAITLTATNGSIIARNLDSSNNSLAGDGGAITLGATGNIAMLNINSSSTFANGGHITLTANGDITPGNIYSLGGITGAGGNITLTSKAQISAANQMLISDTYGSGKAGDISVTGRSISLTNETFLSASTFGQANGGNVLIKADDAVTLANSYIFSNVEAGAVGIGGDITIKAGSLALTEGAQLQTLLREASNTAPAGRGKAGNVTIDVRDAVTVTGTDTQGLPSSIFSTVENGAVGQGGDININASSLALRDNALVSSSSFGSGKAGNLTISTDRLTVESGAKVGAVTAGVGQGGKLTVTASELVELSGTASGLFTTNEAGTGNAGDLEIDTRRLIVRDGAGIYGSTRGAGNAGNLIVKASDSVQLIGTSSDGYSSGLFSESFASGNAGNLTIETERLIVRDGAVASVGTESTSQGRGGNLTIKATQSVELSGTSTNGELFSSLITAAKGSQDAGNLTINTSRLTVRDGGLVLASTLGLGRGGDLTVNASDLVEVLGTSADDFPSALSTDTGGTGQAGDLTVNTRHLIIRDGGRVGASTFNNGNAGTLRVNASQSVELSGTSGRGRPSSLSSSSGVEGIPSNPFVRDSGLQLDPKAATGQGGDLNIVTGQLIVRDGAAVTAATFGQGLGGNIQVQANSLTLSNRAQLSAATSGTGRAGNISVQEADSIALSNSSISTAVNAGAVVNDADNQGGNINLQTRQLSFTNKAQVSAATSGTGNAGSIDIRDAQEVSLSNSSISTAVNAGAVGQGGSVDIHSRLLSLQEGAQVSAATSGQGDAGSIIVREADAISLSNSSISTAVNVGAVGQGGDVDIQTRSLSVNNRAQISANTSGQGNAGSIKVTANTLETINGGQLLTSTASSEKAGNITLKITDNVTLAGTGSGVFANTAPGSAGNGGSIFLNPRTLLVRDGAGIAVGSQGTGKGGDIEIQSDLTTLDNGGFISAKTASTNGGNITLTAQDLLLLRRGSEISTTAGTAQAGGNGGNININAGFILAVPQENSDITANAFTGRGGNINITTQAIFGLDFRPRLTPLSDITASSEFGLNGSVQINTLGIDPNRGLAELPTDIVDATGLLDRRCAPNRGTDQRSSFTITGRGGIPPSPNDPLMADTVEAGWVSLDSEVETPPTPSTNTQPSSSSPKPLVEAQGWVFLPDGRVMLTAEAPTATPQHPWQTPASCQTLSNSSNTH